MRYLLAVFLLLKLLFVGLATASEKAVETGSPTSPDPGTAVGQSYESPPEKVAKALSLEPVPDVSVSPDGQWMVIEWDRPILARDVTAPTLEIGGLRVDPTTGNRRGTAEGKFRTSIRRLTLVRLSDQKEFPVEGAPDRNMSGVLWAPNSRAFAFLQYGTRGTQLWVVDLPRNRARMLEGASINDAAPQIEGGPGPGHFKSCLWLPDSVHLGCLAVSPPAAPADSADGPLVGPIVHESDPAMPATRFDIPGILDSREDQAVFERFAQSQLQLINTTTGERRSLWRPGVFMRFVASPSGEYFVVEYLLKPYSRRVPYWMSKRSVVIVSRDGRTEFPIGEVPELQRPDQIASVAPPGIRQIVWDPSAANALVYVQARPKEQGDELIRTEAPFSTRDVIFSSAARIDTSERWTSTGGWTDDGRVVIHETDARARIERLWRLDLKNRRKPILLSQRARQNALSAAPDREFPFGTLSRSGHQVLLRNGDWIYLRGTDRSEGGVPFARLRALNLTTGATKTVYRVPEGRYETILNVLDPSKDRILVQSQSPDLPVEYQVVSIADGQRRTVMGFTASGRHFHPFNQQRIELNYKRKDGVGLQGVLFAPADFRRGTPIPVLVWGYPHLIENQPGQALLAQRSVLLASDSPFRNQSLSSSAGSDEWIRVLTEAGIGVFYAPMPTGDGRTMLGQYQRDVELNASAAAQQLICGGISARGMLAVGGHSAGGSLAASIASVSDVYSAAISVDGNYNAVVSPFGWGFESRSYWQAKDVYRNYSPFESADVLRAPLLLLQGQADTNPGTPVERAEEMFEAAEGLGKKVRLVVFPGEGHDVRSSEGKLHAAAEIIRWIERFATHESEGSSLSAGRCDDYPTKP